MPKNAPKVDDAADERIELTDEWAVEEQPPVKVSLFGKPYDIRCDYTGAEVLEFSHLLQKEYKVGKDGKASLDAITELWEERFAFILTAGDARQLAIDIGEQNAGVADRLINQIYKHAGMLDAEGNFKAL
ncbi:hypothetical protein [Rhodococcus sp. BE178]|uniref:hypothetical protein n=1 Tax=Rhodococcus sp. BE178 TaxID=2817737 RepID=UPI003D1AA6D4